MPLLPSQIAWVPLDGLAGCTVAIGLDKDSVRPVMLDSHCDSVGYLGCLLSPNGEPFELLEVRIQETRQFAESEDAKGEAVTNARLADRWRRLADCQPAEISDHSVFRGPWERDYPAPAFLDPSTGTLAEFPESWRLCTDDEALNQRRLAPFSSSPHRYLVDREAQQFIPLSNSAPTSPDTIAFEKVFGDLVPINPEGGLMRLRRLPQFSFAGFGDFISGKNFSDDPDALLLAPVATTASSALLKNTGPANPGFLHAKGEPADRLAEVLFLKFTLLHQAFHRVSEAVAAHGVPMLGISDQSFAVYLAQPSSSLPFLWNARVELCSAPSVMRVPLGQTNEHVIVPCETLPRSIYRADHATSRLHGTARVRIRKITPPDDDGFSIIEGTLQTDEALSTSRKDLLELELRIGRAERLKIHANFVDSAAEGRGLRFLSLPQIIPKALVPELERGGAQFFERVEFQILPRLGSTHDLFSLGVLATRLLLCNGNLSLAETVDEILSLTEAYGETMGGNNWETGAGHLSGFVASEKGRHWRNRLGPTCLVNDVTPEDASSVPAMHWWQTVEFVARLFPGSMPGAFCKDLDDFDARFPEKVFNDPIEGLDTLLEHSRTLLFDSPSTSREILSVVNDFAKKFEGSKL